MTPILELQDLSFRYEGGLPGEKVLDALTFAVERVGLVGCNGVGKSTLLKILVGILPIQAGALTVGGLPMERKNLAEIRRKVGYIFQDSDSQLFMPTVRADVAFAAENYGYPPEEVAARTRRALTAVHMEHCADRPVYRLSGGQKKLASIAGILTLEPELLIADEATSMLDVTTQAQILRLFQKLRKERGLSLLLISHDRPMVDSVSDRIYQLTDGKMIEND